MLDLVPLAGPRGIMTDRHVQARLVCPTLQFHLPQPKAIAITAPAVSTNQHTLCPSIKGVAHLSPPTTNALHGKTRRVMGTAHGHPPLISAAHRRRHEVPPWECPDRGNHARPPQQVALPAAILARNVSGGQELSHYRRAS